uniref:VWFD domain-containing protein n=1 Tax=Macrostomum lignano TaxID=282301 RepID=A0A1I8HEQ4_9PLAT
MKIHAASLTVVIAVVCLWQPVSATTSFWNSQYSTAEFAQFRYKNQFMLSIFQHLTKNNTFYITPLVLLDHRSGSLMHNPFTEYWELRFSVIMWDMELQASVYNFLTTVKGVRNPDVKLLPMERVRFQWQSRSRPIVKKLVMETEFIATHHLPRLLTLTFACKNQSQCAMLKDKVREDPESLDSLKLDCFLTAQKTASKTVRVTTDNLMQSTTFSKLLMLPKDGNYRYMRADDFNNLVQETYSSVRATTIRSTEYVEKYDELNISTLDRERAEAGRGHHQHSQPNAVAERLLGSDIRSTRQSRKRGSQNFKKEDSTGQLRVDRAYLRSNEEARKLFGSSRSLSGSGGDSISGSLSHLNDRYTMDELNRKLSDANLNVEWNGERFIVSPMRLVRINEQAYRSRRELISNNMQLTIYQQSASLSVIVRQEHNETAMMRETAATVGAFPTEYSYCLLSNGGSCPPGFTRSSGFMKSIRLDTSSSGMISKAKLGDSAIKCHSPGDSDDCSFRGWEPFKGELHLHVCCR